MLCHTPSVIDAKMRSRKGQTYRSAGHLHVMSKGNGYIEDEDGRRVPVKYMLTESVMNPPGIPNKPPRGQVIASSRDSAARRWPKEKPASTFGGRQERRNRLAKQRRVSVFGSDRSSPLTHANIPRKRGKTGRHQAHAKARISEIGSPGEPTKGTVTLSGSPRLRCVSVSYETVRCWCEKFDKAYATGSANGVLELATNGTWTRSFLRSKASLRIPVEVGQ
jgi:hypothetical protein